GRGEHRERSLERVDLPVRTAVVDVGVEDRELGGPGAVEPRTNSSVDRRSPRIAGILTHGSLPICTAYHNHAAAAGRHTRHGRYPTLAASATDATTSRFASPPRGA